MLRRFNWKFRFLKLKFNLINNYVRKITENKRTKLKYKSKSFNGLK